MFTNTYYLESVYSQDLIDLPEVICAVCMLNGPKLILFAEPVTKSATCYSFEDSRCLFSWRRTDSTDKRRTTLNTCVMNPRLCEMYNL